MSRRKRHARGLPPYHHERAVAKIHEETTHVADTQDDRPIFPDIKVELSDLEGHAFEIRGRVSSALSRVHGTALAQAFADEASQGDYEHLIRTCKKWVRVT